MQKLFSDFTRTLYVHLLKPVLFTQSPELVHLKMVSLGKKFGQMKLSTSLMKGIWAYQNVQTMKKIDGITFPNPVGLAAGFDYDADLLDTMPAIGFGFHTIGTITLQAYEGNPLPRLTRYPRSSSILVNKGLKNIGAAGIIEKLSDIEMKIPTGISIASTNRKYQNEKDQITEITDCFTLFEKSSLSHAYYELNISCPNTFGGEPFTTKIKLERLMIEMDKLKLTRPLYAKMPIDLSKDETLTLLQVLDTHSIQGVIFGNLTKDKTNPDVHSEDIEDWKKAKGNLSGKPTFKRSNACIKLTKKYFGSRFTIIGTGGIFSGEDAYTKILLGADLVQLITGMIYEGPQLIGQINTYLAERKLH